MAQVSTSIWRLMVTSWTRKRNIPFLRFLGCFNSLQLGCQRKICAIFSSRITSILETHDLLHLTKCTVRGSNLLFRNYVLAKDYSLEVLQHIILYLSTRQPWTIGSPGHIISSFSTSKHRLNTLNRIILLEAGHAGCCVQYWRPRRQLENRSLRLSQTTDNLKS